MAANATPPPSNSDPKGLIREAYRIDGIGVAECRSIFLDWALSLPDGVDPTAALHLLLKDHGEAAPSHPMTEILSAGLAKSPVRRRRRGRGTRTPTAGKTGKALS